MITAELPAALAAAIRARFDIDPGEGRKAGAALSQRYRDARTPPGPRARADGDIAAYALTRLPATYAAASATLGEVRARWQAFAPRSQLDLGAGLGAAAWAAAGTWASLEAVTAVELEVAMLEVGHSLAAAGPPAVARSAWRRGDAMRELPEGSFDLVTIAYLLGELDPGAVVPAVERAWAATAGALVIVEPGTPEGYRRVIAARARLLSLGAFTVAPCPHDRPCPLGEADWCHFAVRLPRSREHRSLKSARLGYEDEKFSYVVVAREHVPQAPARILRHPQVRGGHVRLELCAAEGLREAVVSKRDGDLFGVARKASWGDAIDVP